MSSVLERADRETILRVNGRTPDPPGAAQYFSIDEIGKLRRFADVVARDHVGRLMFARGRPVDPNPNSDVRPQEGQLINRIRVTAGGVGLSGLTRALPRHEDLSIRMRKKMRKDPQFALGLAAIKAPIMAAFEAIRVNCRNPRIRGFVHHCLMNEEGGILRRAVFTALKSLEFGFAPHEMIWQNNRKVTFLEDPEDGGMEPTTETIDNASVLVQLADLDPEYTEVLLSEKNGDYQGLRYGFDSGQRVPPDKTWLVTHDMEFGQILGQSVLDNNYDSWLWCNIMYLFTNRYYERRASPPIKGRAPAVVVDNEGNTLTGVEIFTKMLDTLISEGVIVLPSEEQGEGTGRKPLWDVEYMTDDRRGEMFLRYIEHLQTLKLRGMLIPEMVIERGAPAGSYGMAQAHTDTFVGMLTLVLEGILFHINRYLVTPLVKYNFGDEAEYCSIDTLTRIGDRKDLLEQLLFTIINAEGKQGSLDTARIIDLIALLRQLNINPGVRRDLPDFQKKTDTNLNVLERQIALQENAQKIQEKNTDAQLKIQEKSQKMQERNTGKQLRIQERAQKTQARHSARQLKIQEKSQRMQEIATHMKVAATVAQTPGAPAVARRIVGQAQQGVIKQPPQEGVKSQRSPTQLPAPTASASTLATISEAMLSQWKLETFDALANQGTRPEVPLTEEYCDAVIETLASNGLPDDEELATEITARRVTELNLLWDDLEKMSEEERARFLLELEIL